MIGWAGFGALETRGSGFCWLWTTLWSWKSNSFRVSKSCFGWTIILKGINNRKCKSYSELYSCACFIYSDLDSCFSPVSLCFWATRMLPTLALRKLTEYFRHTCRRIWYGQIRTLIPITHARADNFKIWGGGDMYPIGSLQQILWFVSEKKTGMVLGWHFVGV